MVKRDIGFSFQTMNREAARLGEVLACSNYEDNLLLLGSIISNYGIIMDRLEAMAILLQVAEKGSFSAASL
jgi:predicted glycosyltransferase